MANRLFRAPDPAVRRLLDELILNCERLWGLVQGTRAFREKGKVKYQPEYHLLCVAHNMMNGYKCSGIVIVPRDKFMRSHFPQVRNLQQPGLTHGRIKVKSFTQTCKQFKNCIVELIQAQQKQRFNALGWCHLTPPTERTLPCKQCTNETGTRSAPTHAACCTAAHIEFCHIVRTDH
jgi:hypothetical protein